MQITYSTRTDVGLHRGNNEDAVRLDASLGLLILADGMGGYNAGEVASAMAVDVIAREMGRQLNGDNPPRSVRDLRRIMEVCVSDANRAIFDAAHSKAAYAGMGTTLVMALLQGESLLIGHVGDSRAYRWRGGILEQITRDHSLLQEQIDAGILTPEEAAVSPNRNLVTRALGVEDSVLLDVQTFSLLPGDTYMLCSDGLSDMADCSQIAAVFAEVLPADQRAARLIELANDLGGQDNSSVAILQMAEVPKKSGIVAKLRRQH